tara:strand:+ start:754 stop:1746 length:993 start_codon:yes stop_codon:yes gene_type:complete
MDDISEFISKSSGKCLILCHQNADLDCVCSAIALKYSLKSINPNLKFEIGAAENYSNQALKILDTFDVTASINPKLDSDILIILDTSSLNLLQPLSDDVENFKGEVLLIDHHPTDDNLRSLSKISYLDNTAASTTELVYEVIIKSGAKIEGVVALALMMGIYSDTCYLKYANPKTIRIVSEILKDSDVDYDKFLEILSSTEDFSEKLANLKASQKMKIHIHEDYFLVTSNVNSSISLAANALIDLGADCTFVGSQIEDVIKISARASSRFGRATSIDLGSIMGEIGVSINGNGGGHKGAAAAKGKGNLKKTLNDCIELVKNHFNRAEGNC